MVYAASLYGLADLYVSLYTVTGLFSLRIYRTNGIQVCMYISFLGLYTHCTVNIHEYTEGESNASYRNTKKRQIMD